MPCGPRAFELAPSTAGTIDSAPFEWIADADMRLGPVCEAIINGRYYWLPFSHLSRVDIEAPPTCAISSGCRPTSSSATAARASV
jgi:protein involved in temperature-dependent protein secretion